jgi:hypothetical protein
MRDRENTAACTLSSGSGTSDMLHAMTPGASLSRSNE